MKTQFVRCLQNVGRSASDVWRRTAGAPPSTKIRLSSYRSLLGTRKLLELPAARIHRATVSQSRELPRSRRLAIKPALRLRRADLSTRQRHGLEGSLKPELRLGIRLSPRFGFLISVWCTNLDGFTHLSAASPSTSHSRELPQEPRAPVSPHPLTRKVLP
jgi:hypothetical protein